MHEVMLLLAVLLPLIAGALLPAVKLSKAKRNIFLMSVTLLTSLLVCLLLANEVPRLNLIMLNDQLEIALRLDDTGRVFAGLLALLWPLTLLYAFSYMKGDQKQTTFFSFFTMSYGVTLGIAFSANLLTLYVFYELMTLSTLPLVMHGGSGKSVSAGLKYLYYSLGGSAFAFIGLVYLVYFGNTTEFVPGGLFQQVEIARASQLRLGYLLCFLGFSVKAAVFPVHAWLPAASVAPTPVTALLHAVAVVKAGVFAIIRVTFFSFGVAAIRDSFAQYIPLALCAFTIVFGCAMALKETHLKRRMAFSTVSNLSYVLFGTLLLTQSGLQAGLMHMVFHALMKIALFLCVGVFNKQADAYYVEDVRGMSKRMPLITAIFALSGLAMTGIPPLIGFISKYALAEAAFQQVSLLSMLGVTALLISAILTGIYLLVPALTMYSVKSPVAHEGKIQVDRGYAITLVTLGALVVVLSFYSKPLLDFLARAAAQAM